MWFSHGIEFQAGMRGELVQQVQQAIGAGADGIFGPRTQAKLEAFQQLHGLPVTGAVDEATWHAAVHGGTASAPSEVEAQDGGNTPHQDDLLAGARLDGSAADWFAAGVVFQTGMKGDLVRQLQRGIGAGADGAFGPKTAAKLRSFQDAHGLSATGVVDQATWAAVINNSKGVGDLQGEEDFARMWAAHPHNYLDDDSENTTSDALRDELGLTEAEADNTCALRMSTMLNRLGDGTALTTSRGREAGLDEMRDTGLYMPRVGDEQTDARDDRAILSAREMWTYLEAHRGTPDETWPARGRYASEEEAKMGVEQLRGTLSGKKGFICFDKIYGYGGSGHVDLFDGPQLSDGELYPAQRILIWHVVNGETAASGLT
jgi:peptidoglycan hydrolase-like protein with peptidoglycan-binding domain